MLEKPTVHGCQTGGAFQSLQHERDLLPDGVPIKYAGYRNKEECWRSTRTSCLVQKGGGFLNVPVLIKYLLKGCKLLGLQKLAS